MRAPDQDLRVRRTRDSIRRAFEEMVMEMDYHAISIRELAERAVINRKTFYQHYPSMDDLLEELQDSIVERFVQRTARYDSIKDMAAITREFFLFCESQGALHQRLICSGNYRFLSDRIISRIMGRNHRHIESIHESDGYKQKMIQAFLIASNMEIYRQWVNDGRKIPVEDAIQLASDLVCNGVNGVTSR